MIVYQLLQEAEVLKFIMKCPHFVYKKSQKGPLSSKTRMKSYVNWFRKILSLVLKTKF